MVLTLTQNTSALDSSLNSLWSSLRVVVVVVYVVVVVVWNISGTEYSKYIEWRLVTHKYINGLNVFLPSGSNLNTI